ncbi:MAG TPA: hypothetical protein VIM52_12270 [Stellaceae bacterium]
MARTGKLSAVEVTKAKGPAVLHDGGGLYLRVAAPRPRRHEKPRQEAPSGNKPLRLMNDPG